MKITDIMTELSRRISEEISTRGFVCAPYTYNDNALQGREALIRFDDDPFLIGNNIEIYLVYDEEFIVSLEINGLPYKDWTESYHGLRSEFSRDLFLCDASIDIVDEIKKLKKQAIQVSA